MQPPLAFYRCTWIAVPDRFRFTKGQEVRIDARVYPRRTHGVVVSRERRWGQNWYSIDVGEKTLPCIERELRAVQEA